MKNFLIRSVSGAVYVFVLTIGIMWSCRSFLVLFSLITFLCLREFYSLMNAEQKTNIPFFHYFGGVILFISVYLYSSGTFSHCVLWLYILYLIFVLISGFWQKQKNFVLYVSYVLFGQYYIAFPFSLLNIIAFDHHHVYSSKLLLSFFIFIWIHDSVSYIFGKKFGKHCLFKRISPQKTWEGFICGFIVTLFVSLVFPRFIPIIPSYHWVGMAIIVSLFGTCGDLVESLIKRTLGVKDFSSVIPGHGGFLDRFDSLLITVYVFCFYLEWFTK